MERSPGAVRLMVGPRWFLIAKSVVVARLVRFWWYAYSCVYAKKRKTGMVTGEVLHIQRVVLGGVKDHSMGLGALQPKTSPSDLNFSHMRCSSSLRGGYSLLVHLFVQSFQLFKGEVV